MNAKLIHPSQISGTPPPPTKLNIEPSSTTKISKGRLKPRSAPVRVDRYGYPEDWGAVVQAGRCMPTMHGIYKNLIKGSRHE